MNYPGIHPKYNFRDSEIAFSDNNFQMAIFVQNFKIICRVNYGKIREFTTIIIFMILPQKWLFRLEKSTIEKISEFNLFIGCHIGTPL